MKALLSLLAVFCLHFIKCLAFAQSNIAHATNSKALEKLSIHLQKRAETAQRHAKMWQDLDDVYDIIMLSKRQVLPWSLIYNMGKVEACVEELPPSRHWEMLV